ncbi:MAG: zinc-ribbon domain-containing protein [Methanobacteriaceae archaeon]|nr:zinc-ribbon domain-containing protein [Methanobacteriaceae archaeon]
MIPTINCPKCGAENDSTFLFCEKCGTKLNQPSPQPEPEPQIEKEEKSQCPRCGYENEKGANFCLNCGLSLKETQNIQTTPTPAPAPEPQFTPQEKTIHDADAQYAEKSPIKTNTPPKTEPQIQTETSEQTPVDRITKKKQEKYAPPQQPSKPQVKPQTHQPQQTTYANMGPKKQKHTILSFILAIIFIGAGSWYNGQIKRGFIYFILAAIFFLGIGYDSLTNIFFMLLALIYFIQIIDATLSARDINMGKEPKFLGII